MQERVITAVLGPTNTGKTHLAIERLVANPSGMMGLPLRLLAREVYDRVVAIRGKDKVALVTGEEKIWPDSARYFICTVEAMPLDVPVDFMAIDEIQLSADPDRGHIFTDRLLHARGRAETMLLGSDTMRPLVRKLVPKAEIAERERLSTLSYAGRIKLTKLPRRTAVVAFSAQEVYAIAELIRRQRGGAAVVMGALSPRTRNAQVALYQDGEVDFLVATDAIGMGLNMDVDHVAFASVTKFDGRRVRRLTPAEMGQIAGRAGRFTRDGTFGESGECLDLDPEEVTRVEDHQFNAVDWIEWRNRSLEFTSLAALLAALQQAPGQQGLKRVQGALDEVTLERVAAQSAVVPLVGDEHSIRRLWEVCQTPDFRHATADEHASLVGRLAENLLSGKQRIPEDFLRAEIVRLDRDDGDMDVLQGRLAQIRTWTYVANRPDWVVQPEHWRNVTRGIEDKLSDTLHERLMQRFIDRRTSALLRSLRKTDEVAAETSADGEVTVEGHFVGQLTGLRFTPDPRAAGLEEKALRNAALKALKPEIDRRLAALAAAATADIRIDDAGNIIALHGLVARLEPGRSRLAPAVTLVGGELGEQHLIEAARLGLERLVQDHVRSVMPASTAIAEAAENHPIAKIRAVAWQISKATGAIERSALDACGPFDEAERKALGALGVRVGVKAVYVPASLKPKPARLAGLLAWVEAGRPSGGPFLPPPSLTLLPAERCPNREAAHACGFWMLGAHLVRIDMLERIAAGLRLAERSAGENGFVLDPALGTLVGAKPPELEAIATALGFRRLTPADETSPGLWHRPKRTKAAKEQRNRTHRSAPAGAESEAPRTSKPKRAGAPQRDKRAPGPRQEARQSHGRGASPFSPRQGQTAKSANPNSPFAGLAALTGIKKDT
jgi:ATP-dependent RNA helicase SUPV3L1/SUV3